MANFDTPAAESHVLVLYVGGTIGMAKSPSGAYIPYPKTLVNILRADPRTHDTSYPLNEDKISVKENRTTLVLPVINHVHRRIIYTIIEYEDLIDSCDVTTMHWCKIAKDIYDNYVQYDGFLILHGTDTLSYTASALSFMFENLGKTVVITGSQIPLCEPRSDGSDNFIGSLIFAGNFTIPEVTVYFHNKLMRGNRTTKFSASALDTFTSPNVSEIAKMGTEITVNYNEIINPSSLDKFQIQTELDENVGVLRIFPNISLILVKSFLESGLKGIVLQTYGCGNITSHRKDLLLHLENAVKRGVFIVNVTQCFNGNVADYYETGQVLSNIGVISGRDMTTEAALNKLSYVLAKQEWDNETKYKMLKRSLRGEMTCLAEDENEPKRLKFNLLMNMKESFTRSAICTSLVIKAIKDQNMEQLHKFKTLGINFNAPNEDNRTPLHVACTIGNPHIVDFLLRNGCLIHVKDDDNKTPLLEAIFHDHHEVIALLRECGAHIPTHLENIGEYLCRSAATGLINRLDSFRLAGVDMNFADYSGRSPLHAAVIGGHVDVVKFLVFQCGVTLSKDIFDETALDCAKKLNNVDMIKVLSTLI